MKQIILTAMIAFMSSAALSAERDTVILGTAVNGGPNGTAVGEAAAGTVGGTDNWHVTAGQIRGIAIVGDPTSTEEIAIDAEAYSVFPNPVHDILNVVGPEAESVMLTVTSLNGAPLLSSTISEAISSINVESLIPDVYIVTINRTDGTTLLSTKIIKI